MGGWVGGWGGGWTYRVLEEVDFLLLPPTPYKRGGKRKGRVLGVVIGGFVEAEDEAVEEVPGGFFFPYRWSG